ncbi:hypothetical protein RRSWK_04585 [Rhodopirellula sp. SWK7]|nr:hypothetical protein RRSWK_04585 [Rhodopirellula sp. SWK7]
MAKSAFDHIGKERSVDEIGTHSALIAEITSLPFVNGGFDHDRASKNRSTQHVGTATGGPSHTETRSPTSCDQTSGPQSRTGRGPALNVQFLPNIRDVKFRDSARWISDTATPHPPASTARAVLQ